MRSAVLLAFALGLVVSTRAVLPPGGGEVLIQRWGAEEGLPQNTVTCVVQTRDGYLWAGTYSGLARFDGVRFVVFDASTSPGLRDGRVTSLCEDADGALWIGHAGGELTRYRGGHFEPVHPPAEVVLGKILALLPDASGDLWVLDKNGLCLRVRDGRVCQAESGQANGLLSHVVTRDGTIWLTYNGALSRLERGELSRVVLPGGSTNSYVQGIGRGHGGGLWVASDGRLRKLLRDRWLEDLGEAPWGMTPIECLAELGSGDIVAGTPNQGLHLISRSKTTPAAHFARTNGLGSDWVNNACEDREGSLWVGTSGGGLLRLRPMRVQTVSPPDRWQGRAVLSVSPGREGALWVGTEGAGLYRLRGGQWTHFGAEAGIHLYVWSVVEDAEGAVWLGTWGGGVFAGTHDQFKPAPGFASPLPPTPAILCSRQGGLWVGTETGLLRYRAGESSWVGQDPLKPSHQVRAIVEETDGTVWFGTAGGGVGCLKNGEIRRFRKADGLSSDYIECLHRDRDGALWIGTTGGGLNRLKAGRIAVIDKQRGLPDNTICHIEEDTQDCFWMSSHNGILRVRKADLDACADGRLSGVESMNYGLSDGMPTLQCSGGLQPAGCQTPDGRLWFPTGRGLVVVNPANVWTNSLPPPVVVERLTVDDRSVVEGAALHAALKIPPGRHRLEFQYTGLSFIAPEKVRFRHRLRGFQSEWSAPQTRRVADYSYLPPGDYSFEVTACNNDGVWNDAPARVAFTVLPLFWQTGWFRLSLWVMLFALSGSGVWYFARRRMRRALELSERRHAVEQERTRIARDIHDDLGSNLTRITMLSETARGDMADSASGSAELRQIYETARELTHAMDEIVWAVNPRHDTLESLVSYLEKFAQDFLRSAGLRCRLDVPLPLPLRPLTAEVRHNLFLAFKEAMNNAVKHAGASEVRISLELKTAGFTLAVEDNGRGFIVEEARQTATCDGLENMTRRLAKIGGQCEILSASGQGTRVVFTVPDAAPALPSGRSPRSAVS